jgi:hypothetical protein
MNFERYAGMASAVGILLILTLVTWLGLWGPVNLSKLHEWQTLTTGITTGIMALIAASIAYRGATAKVRHDREVLAQEIMRRKLALYLKIEFAFRQLTEEARNKSAQVSFGPLTGMETIRAHNFMIDEPTELEEAWTYLDLFPRKIISEIRNVRNCLRKLAKLEVDLDGKGIAWEADRDPHPMIKEAQSLLGGLWHSAALVTEELDPLIDELAPEMDDSERMTRIYGDPGYDED